MIGFSSITGLPIFRDSLTEWPQMATKRKSPIKPEDLVKDYNSGGSLADRLPVAQRMMISLAYLAEWEKAGRKGEVPVAHKVWLGLLDRGARYEVAVDLPVRSDLRQAAMELARDVTDPSGVAEDFAATNYQKALRTLKARIEDQDTCGAGDGRYRAALEYIGDSAGVGKFRAMKSFLTDLDVFETIFFDICNEARRLSTHAKQSVFDLLRGTLWPQSEMILRRPGPFWLRRMWRDLRESLSEDDDLDQILRNLNSKVDAKVP